MEKKSTKVDLSLISLKKHHSTPEMDTFKFMLLLSYLASLEKKSISRKRNNYCGPISFVMSNLKEMAFRYYMKLSNAENCGSNNKNNGIFIDVVLIMIII